MCVICVQGMYSEFLDDWLRVFPRDQLLILRNEDYKVTQREHMEVIFKFLGTLLVVRSACARIDMHA